MADSILAKGQESHLNSLSEDESSRYLQTEERDEVKEVQKIGRADTDRVRTWRFIVRAATLMTSLAVTLTTFSFLKLEDDNDFKTAFNEVADSLSTAALDQQRNIQTGYQAVADIMTAHAASSKEVWPFVTLPFFESYAAHIRAASQVEVLMVANLVKEEERTIYLNYTGANYETWVTESHEFSTENVDEFSPTGYANYIRRLSLDEWIPDVPRADYWSTWQLTPPPYNYELINWNVASNVDLAALIKAGTLLKNETLYSRISALDYLSAKDHDTLHNARPTPHAYVSRVIHDQVGNDDSPVVAVVTGGMAWDVALKDVLQDQQTGVRVVIRNTCNQNYTYEINGPTVDFVGEGDLHEIFYNRMEVVVNLSTSNRTEVVETVGHCLYSMSIYPSARFEAAYDSDTPRVFACVVASTFVAMALVFFIYDIFVQRRNDRIIEQAARANAIVSSLFPSTIRDRMIGEHADIKGAKNLKAFMANKNGSSSNLGATKFDSKPLADLFLNTTVLFADIVGFTAWSSVREPTQVFTLLETVYAAFDEIAKQRGVFKVETVGDCYVAVTGLPEARQDHPLAMVRFARDIMNKFQVLTNRLEVELGPDTGGLGLRIGIHSGAVTAGVLRGERARFQLFGDTMNTTARIETTGASNRIHLSQDTADLVIKAGKGHWLFKREEMVQAKGKGNLQTYWLSDMGGTTNSVVSDTEELHSEKVVNVGQLQEEHVKRLISWNASTLLKLIQAIVAHREAKKEATKQTESRPWTLSRSINASRSLSLDKDRIIEEIVETNLIDMHRSPLDEVKEIISLPAFDQNVAKMEQNPEDVEMDAAVVAQLQDYVTCIASMYRDNAFHNFEHASHVTMSVIKLLSRIVAPSEFEEEDEHVQVAATLHDHTYGITSDPLTQFACAFSALIHDVDHVGVPNAQLIKENASIAAVYNNRSVAEQNSLVLSWELLMDSRFDDLRNAICATTVELGRFRELIVNGVMATDIADKELKALRNARWDKAFEEKEHAEIESPRDTVSRKATIVIEHLIQASDISHTMQHWHVYRKWNENLFKEMHAAYTDGRAERDPSEFWYKGEIGFFDFYIIPLAKKLKDCGVFRKSSDEYLNYALANRNEWESRGQQVVAELIQSVSN